MQQTRSDLESRQSLSRRQFGAGFGAALAVLALPGRATGRDVPQDADGFSVLRARAGTAALRGTAFPPTAILGYNGVAPGPLLRARRGEEIRVRLVNELPDPTTIHWHGLRLPNAMDGVPHLTQAPVVPGGSFDYRFTAPDAGTFWYHAHVSSSEQVGRGLHGALIVEERDPVDVDQDILLVVDDWRLTESGAIAPFGSFHDAAHAGRLGSHLSINGTPKFDVTVRTNERLRLRIVNVANARIMVLHLDGARARVMAIDGQPAEPFIARDGRIVLGPGNRIDLFMDATLTPGSTATLVARDDGAIPLVSFNCASGAPARAAPRDDAAPLPANPLPERMDFASALKIVIPIEGGAMSGMMGGAMMQRGPMSGGMMGGGMMGGPSGGRPDAIWSLSGRASDGHTGAPIFSIRRGGTAMLAFANRTAFPHAVHIHGHHFRLLDRRDDGWKPFWLDTLVLPPRETWRIAFVADNPGKWMLHCHMLEHQESGMAGWFAVT